MQNLIDFLSLANANDRYVLLSVILLSAGAAMVGCFTLLRKRALVGDAVAHSVLPGICLAFMLSGTRDPIWLMLGAVVTGWLSLLAIDIITRYSKLKSDAAIAIVLTAFFGAGVLLLSTIQNSGAGNQSGLDHFLFGESAWLTKVDMYSFGGMALVLIVIIVVFFKGFKIVSFNPEYAKVIGLPVKFYEFVLATITVLAVAVGIKAVGVVLMAALLITPAATARFWTNKLHVMLILAALFGVISGTTGAFISSSWSTPTAPWIVVALSVLVGLSIMFSPQRGLLARWQQLRKNRRKILQENILKAFYRLGEADENWFELYSEENLQAKRSFPGQQLQAGLRQLKQKRLLAGAQGQFQLTFEGLEAGKRIVKLHRLWELYLTQRMRMQADHIHPNAESIEHIITPEIEALLEQELNFPERDPHDSTIPYRNSGKR